MIQCVVFDAASTLLHMQPRPEEIYCEEARALGVKTTAEFLLGRFPSAYTDAFGDGLYSTDQADQKSRWFQVVRSCFPHVGSPKIDTLFERLWNRFGTAETWKLDRDAEDLFAWLDQSKIRIAIASNFDSRLRSVMSEYESLRQLTDVYISSEVGWCKPNPKFYKAVADGLGLATGDLLMVGDSHRNDIEVPTFLGWQAVHFTPALSGSPHPLAIDRLAQLRKFVA